MFGYKIYSSIFGGWMGSSSQYYKRFTGLYLQVGKKANLKNQL